VITIALYWAYLIGEEHLTEEQFASIDFGNPALDTEFIIFDPLASSFFQGKYFTMHEKRFLFPHKKLPTMRPETILTYEETTIKIINPPIDLETPVGIFQCIFTGKKSQITRAINFLGKKLNLRFSPCDLDIEQFYSKISKTRMKISPISFTISDLNIDANLIGNLEVFINDNEKFLKNLKAYKPKNQQIKLAIQEVNYQIELQASINGTIIIEQDIENLNLLETIYDIACRSVFTGTVE